MVWLSDSGTLVSKYMPLNQSNVGIAFMASRYKNFNAFVTLCGMPATYVSDDEDDEASPPLLQEIPIIKTSPKDIVQTVTS